MSYIINNSRGNVIAIVADGTVNTTATNLALVGRAVTDYGTYENENYVYLLENFANSTAPTQPILGQLWYNSSTDVLSAYNSANTWSALASQDYVQAQKASPAFTGTPTAPTAANGTSTTQLATTAFVLNQLGGSNSIVSVGNITGGNLLTAGIVSAGGSITSSANIVGGNIIGVGTISAGGNITAANFVGNLVGSLSGGNVVTPGILSAGGNVYGANFVGNITIPAGAPVSTTGNVVGGNMLTSGSISAVGNVYGANFVGNITIPAGSPVSTTGNVVGGNMLTSGSISATGNVYGANFVGNVTIPAGSPVSTTGNVTAGNILTSGAISAVGNITGGNVVAGTVYATNFVTSGSPTAAFRLPNLTQTQIDALSPQNGDMVYNTTTDLSQVYQNGGWNNFTVSYYS